MRLTEEKPQERCSIEMPIIGLGPSQQTVMECDRPERGACLQMPVVLVGRERHPAWAFFHFGEDVEVFDKGRSESNFVPD